MRAQWAEFVYCDKPWFCCWMRFTNVKKNKYHDFFFTVSICCNRRSHHKNSIIAKVKQRDLSGRDNLLVSLLFSIWFSLGFGLFLKTSGLHRGNFLKRAYVPQHDRTSQEKGQTLTRFSAVADTLLALFWFGRFQNSCIGPKSVSVRIVSVSDHFLCLVFLWNFLSFTCVLKLCT